jgi:hypothetical protein
LAAREAQVSGKPMNVHVDGHEQASGRDAPHAEIDPIGGTDHPPKKKKQTLATARAARIRQQVRRPAALAVSAEAAGASNGVTPGGERRAKTLVRRTYGRRSRELEFEQSAQRPVRALHRAGARQKARDVFSSKDPGAPSAKRRLQRRGIVGGLGRTRTHAVEEIGKLGADDFRVAEGDACRDQSHDFTVRAVNVTMYGAHGVRVPARGEVAARAHGVERFLHRDFSRTKRPAARG